MASRLHARRAQSRLFSSRVAAALYPQISMCTVDIILPSRKLLWLLHSPSYVSILSPRGIIEAIHTHILDMTQYPLSECVRCIHLYSSCRCWWRRTSLVVRYGGCALLLGLPDGQAARCGLRGAQAPYFFRNIHIQLCHQHGIISPDDAVGSRAAWLGLAIWSYGCMHIRLVACVCVGRTVRTHSIPGPLDEVE